MGTSWGGAQLERKTFQKWRCFRKVEQACVKSNVPAGDVAGVWNREVGGHYRDACDERRVERGEFSVHDRRSARVTGPEIAIRRTRKGEEARMGGGFARWR